VRAKLKGGPFDGKELDALAPCHQHKLLIPVVAVVTPAKEAAKEPAQTFVFTVIQGPFAEYKPEAEPA